MKKSCYVICEHAGIFISPCGNYVLIRLQVIDEELEHPHIFK